MNNIIIEAKTEEELKKKITEELGCDATEVFYVEKGIKKSLFNKKIEYDVVKIEDLIDYVKKEIKTLSTLMNIPFNVEIKEREKIIKIVIDSDENALLIGKQGKTLESLLTILKQNVKNRTGMFVKMTLDIGHYKESNDKRLEIRAKKLAKEVMATGIEAKMDSMNSYQRRVVHSVLNDYKGIKTESVGEEPNRSVVIKKGE